MQQIPRGTVPTNVIIKTIHASQLQDEWKNELLHDRNSEPQSAVEQFQPTYAFHMEFTDGIPVSHIPIINDITPKMLIKKDKQIVLRSIAHKSAPSLFYYILLDVIGAVPQLDKLIRSETKLDIGLIGDETLSTQLFFHTLGNASSLHEFSITRTEGDAPIQKFDVIVDSNHNSNHNPNNHRSKIIANNINNTHNVRVITSALSALNKGGALIMRILPKSTISAAIASILSAYFTNTFIARAFNGELFIICVEYDDSLQLPDFNFTYTPSTYVEEISGISIDKTVSKIINVIPQTYKPILNTNKEIIADIKEKIDSSIAFLEKRKVKLSIYYQPEQILSELDYFLSKKDKE